MDFTDYVYLSVIFLATSALAAIAPILNPITSQFDYVTKVDTTTLAPLYILNNPATVQKGTMTISGQAQFNRGILAVYASSPTVAQTGEALMAQIGTAAPCIWTYDSGGNRYRLCFTLDNPPAGGNSGQCVGILCGLTYP